MTKLSDEALQDEKRRRAITDWLERRSFRDIIARVRARAALAAINQEQPK